MEVVKEIGTDCKSSHSECNDVLQSNSDSDDGAFGNLFASWEYNMTNGEDNDNTTTNVNNDKSNAVELYPIETLVVDRKVMMSEGIGNDEPFNTLYKYFDGYCNVKKEYEQVLLSEESLRKNEKILINENNEHIQDATTLATTTTKYAFECAIKRKVCAEWEATGTNVQMNVHYRNKRHSLWGHKLWNAAKYLAKRIDSGLIDVFNKRVLELGAGLGVPSLVSYLNGAKLTVITDYPDEELLEILRMNAEENCVISKLDKRALHKYAEMFAQLYLKSSITDKNEAIVTKASKEDYDSISKDESRLECKLEETSVNSNDDNKDMFTPTLEEMLNSYIQCHVCPLLWGNEDHMAHVYSLTSSHPHDSESGFDCIFLSDILFNHVCNDDLVYTVAELLSKANKSAAAYCVFSHHRPHKQLQDYQFFDKCVAHGLQWTLLDVVEHSYPLMFAEDKGPEHVRQPVKCYKLTLATDLAGLPVELSSCIKYNHDEKEHLHKEGKEVMNNNNTSTDVTAEDNAKKDDVKYADSNTIAKLKFARNKQKNAMIDVVINGTGPVQSFLSAALARSSCNVVHCDGSAHYGGAFWTLNLRDFHNYLTRHAEFKENYGDPNAAAVIEIASSRVMSCLDEQSPALCTSANVHINHMNTLSAIEQTQFQIDFLPASYMAAGDTINYIIEFNTTQYLEFQNYNMLCFLVPSQQITPNKEKNTEVIRKFTTCTNSTDPVLNMLQDASRYSWNLHDAPLTRSAVFASSLLSLLDKRRLMKFVKDIADVLVEQHHAMHSNLSDDPNYHSHNTTHIHYQTEQNGTIDTTTEGDCNKSDGIVKTVRELPEAVVEAIKGNYAITLPAFLQSHYKLSNDAVNILTLFGAANVMECVRHDCNVSHSKLEQLNALHLHTSSPGEVESEEERQAKYHKSIESNTESISVLTRQECERICGAPLAQSIRFIRQLLFSVNRFGGSTPLLLPCYGSGEIIQGMCRNSAVYGSTFVLRRSVQGIAIPSLPNIGESERMQFAVLSNGQHIPAKVIVTPVESASQIAVTLEEWKYILRAGKRLMRTRNTLYKKTSNSEYCVDTNDDNCEEDNEEDLKMEDEMIKLPLTLETVLQHCNGTHTNHAIDNTSKEHDTNAVHANTISTSVNKDQKEVKESNESRNDKFETSAAFSPSSASSSSPSSSSSLALTRLVVVTKTPLFHQTVVQSYLSASVDENNIQDSNDNYIDRSAPLVMALIKIPEKVSNFTGDNEQENSGNGVIYLVQDTKTSEQAPASVTPRQEHTLISTNNTSKEEEECDQHTFATNHSDTDINNTTVHNHEENANEQDHVHEKTYYGPSILHFMVDGQCMSQEELYNFAMNELLPSLYHRSKTLDGQHNANEESNSDNDDFRSWIIYCASFTISAESVAIAMQVRDPYSPQSETLKTDDYSILDNLKVERAIQHQRDRLLRTHTTQPSTSTLRTSEHDEEIRKQNNSCNMNNNKCIISSNNDDSVNDKKCDINHDSLIDEALEQIHKNMCVFTVPSLLPNVLDDGAYLRRAKEIYQRIMHVLHISHPFLSSHANAENLN